MKTRICSAISCFALLASSVAIGQQEWSTPVRIVVGDDDIVHPTIADGFGWLSNNEELLAFSRNGKNICVLRTSSGGAAWPDSVVPVTIDSADNDFPSLIRTTANFNAPEKAMLVWQGRRRGNLEILYSRLIDKVWSTPQSITNNNIDDQFPHVALNGYYFDSSYFAVWEQQGRIMFSQFIGTSWTPSETVSPPGDTLNHFPQVVRQQDQSGYFPFVIWQKRRTADTTCMILCAKRGVTGWNSPDTLVTNGDNRRPRFYKYGAQSFLTWDKFEGTFRTTFGGYLSISNGKGSLTSVSPLNFESGYQQNASVNGMMIITLSAAPQFLPHGVATWESPLSDSIGVDLGIYGFPFGSKKLSPPGALMNRNPTISQGTSVPANGWSIRYWSVWEALVGGKWQLYASSAIVIIADVKENNAGPERFALYQNYPNPFNPTTVIRFQIADFGLVKLKIFDLLGREVATLVDEEQAAGSKSVTFDASGFSSGVYFYRLNVADYSETKKMMVIR